MPRAKAAVGNCAVPLLVKVTAGPSWTSFALKVTLPPVGTPAPSVVTVAVKVSVWP